MKLFIAIKQKFNINIISIKNLGLVVKKTIL